MDILPNLPIIPLYPLLYSRLKQAKMADAKRAEQPPHAKLYAVAILKLLAEVESGVYLA